MSSIKPILLALPACVLGIGLTASGEDKPKVTYKDHVYPILEDRCLSCHNPDKTKGGLDMTTYAATMNGGSGGSRRGGRRFRIQSAHHRLHPRGRTVHAPERRQTRRRGKSRPCGTGSMAASSSTAEARPPLRKRIPWQWSPTTARNPTGLRPCPSISACSQSSRLRGPMPS